LDVYNRGLAGYNSEWALAAFELIFPSTEKRAFPIELVTIFFGANDAAMASLNPIQHVSLKSFESNMEELTRRCKNEWDVRRIVLIGCPPIDAEKYMNWRRQRAGNESKPDEELMDRTIDIARKYSIAMGKVAKKYRLPFVDLFELFGQHFAECLSDGLHLSPKGNRALGDALIQTIDKNWPEMKCSPDQLRRKYGFCGSTCHAFPPEQKWFTELYATVGAGDEVDEPSIGGAAVWKVTKRMKL
jgi:lysophospholipase L1-like esterase